MCLAMSLLTAMSLRAAKLAKWTTKPLKIEPKRLQKPSPGGVPHRLWGTIRWGTPASRAKKSRKKTSATKKGAASHRVPPFLRKMWPTWPQLGSQEGAKMKKKSMQKSIKNLMPLGIDFWVDFGGFWVPKSSQVGTKMGSKIDVNFERRFFKKHFFFLKKMKEKTFYEIQ